MPLVTTVEPTNGDNANSSLFKINQIFFNSLAGAPVNLAPSRGDTATLSLRKINSLLAQGAGGGNGGGGGGGNGSVSALNDAWYEREDFTDINVVGNAAVTKNLAPTFTTTSGGVGTSFAPWEIGHGGIIELKTGPNSGDHAVMQRNFGFGTPTTIDLTKVNRLIYRAVIKVDTMFLTYSGGGEHSWGFLSQDQPLNGAQFSIAPGFLDTSGVTAGQNIVTGTYQDANAGQMQDLSRPAFPIAALTWYDSVIDWTPTAVNFYMRPFTLAGTGAWTLVGTNTLYIGTAIPVYIERSAKNYGDPVSRSLFVDLEEIYIDIATPKRYLGSGILKLI